MEEQQKQELEAQIKECNEECQSCMESFQRDGITFSSNLCHYCPNGAKLHQLLIKVSEAEAKWGSLDWNSCKYKTFYNG